MGMAAGISTASSSMDPGRTTRAATTPRLPTRSRVRNTAPAARSRAPGRGALRASYAEITAPGSTDYRVGQRDHSRASQSTHSALL